MKTVIGAIAALAALAAPMPMMADDNDATGSPENPKKLTVATDMRYDFTSDHYDDDATGEDLMDNNTGFHGRYFNLIIKGQINDRISFNIRHRLNRMSQMDSDVFGATDWIYLDYSPNDRWTLSGGKQVVGIGGFEYDRNPINVYYASMFWNNIACFQFGASATYHTADGHHNIMAQITNSPYRPIGNSCYAYNLMWMGSMDRFSTLWSANLMEYKKGHFGNFIALGNRIDFDGFYAELDLMNRYWGTGKFLLGDYSIIGKACASLNRKVDIFAKGGYERFGYMPGVQTYIEEPYYGAGIEYYPITGSRDLRLHMVADVTYDTSSAQRRTQFGVGLMWRVGLINK